MRERERDRERDRDRETETEREKLTVTKQIAAECKSITLPKLTDVAVCRES